MVLYHSKQRIIIGIEYILLYYNYIEIKKLCIVYNILTN